MLANVKSLNIIKHIFSFLSDRLTLKVVKENKQFKRKLNISLFNYQIISGKYIINAENKGIVKEYSIYNEQLIFEGEYLNGKRCGKGKEFYFGELIFEGEYKDGKRNGKGKEYNELGKVIFEGDYLFGKKWNGNGYDLDNNILYEIKNGKGYIREYYTNGNLKFEGEYSNGEKNGKCREYNIYKNLIFEGQYFYGKKWNGKGYDIKNNIIYELKDGKGLIKEYYYNNKIKFEGEYLYGEKNGK